MQAGDAPSARAVVDQLVRDDFAELTAETGGYRQLELAILAEICTRLDHTNAAARLLQLMQPYDGLFVHAFQALDLGPMAMYLGMLEATLGCFDDAIDHLDCACARLVETAERALELRGRVELAYAIGAGRDRDEAIVMLQSTRESATALGLVDIVMRGDLLRLKLK